MVEDRLDRIEEILERVARKQDLFAKEMRKLHALQEKNFKIYISPIDRILEGVMKEFGVKRDKIIRRKRSRFEVARDVGIYLLGRYSGLNNKRIGEVFGVG